MRGVTFKKESNMSIT